MQHNHRLQAVIRKVWPTGLYFEHAQQLGLELWVTGPDGQAYPVETLQDVWAVTAAQYQPGRQVSVVVDPGNPRRVVITAVLPG
jgi:hypothetical protein